MSALSLDTSIRQYDSRGSHSNCLNELAFLGSLAVMSVFQSPLPRTVNGLNITSERVTTSQDVQIFRNIFSMENHHEVVRELSLLPEIRPALIEVGITAKETFGIDTVLKLSVFHDPYGGVNTLVMSIITKLSREDTRNLFSEFYRNNIFPAFKGYEDKIDFEANAR